MRWMRVQVDTAIQQARKWAGSGDNGWCLTRPQVTVLADTIDGLREENAALLVRIDEDRQVIDRIGDERDALRARVAELDGAVRDLVSDLRDLADSAPDTGDALFALADRTDQRIGPWTPVAGEAEVARVRAGHGMDTAPRPGGLLGPLPRRSDDGGEARDA